jgi:hypothetical protein
VKASRAAVSACQSVGPSEVRVPIELDLSSTSNTSRGAAGDADARASTPEMRRRAESTRGPRKAAEERGRDRDEDPGADVVRHGAAPR